MKRLKNDVRVKCTQFLSSLNLLCPEIYFFSLSPFPHPAIPFPPLPYFGLNLLSSRLPSIPLHLLSHSPISQPTSRIISLIHSMIQRLRTSALSLTLAAWTKNRRCVNSTWMLIAPRAKPAFSCTRNIRVSSSISAWRAIRDQTASFPTLRLTPSLDPWSKRWGVEKWI